jgi:hypothetical protein
MAHVRAIFNDIVRLSYAEKMGMGCLQIVEVKVKYLLDSYIMT